MLISRSSDYALRALLHLARNAERTCVPLREIAEEQRIPSSLLSKILHGLACHGYVRSYRGLHGGYALEKQPDQISIRDIVVTFDGPPTVFECLDHADLCHLTGHCTLQSTFAQAQQAMLDVLANTTLFDCMQDTIPSH